MHQHDASSEVRAICRAHGVGETMLRYCIVNPRTTLDDIRLIIDSLS